MISPIATIKIDDATIRNETDGIPCDHSRSNFHLWIPGKNRRFSRFFVPKSSLARILKQTVAQRALLKNHTKPPTNHFRDLYIMKKNLLGLAAGCIAALSLTACGETPAPEAPPAKPPVEAVKQKAGAAADKMKGAADKAGEAAGKAGDATKKAGEAAKGMGGEMGKKAGEAADKAGEAAGKAGDAAKKTGEAAGKAGDAMKSGAAKTGEAVKEAVTEKKN
jgi:hypothetical protein